MFLAFPGSSDGEESACSAGDLGSIPGLGRSPGEGKGYPLQYSCQENYMDCIVHGVEKEWDTTYRLNSSSSKLKTSLHTAAAAAAKSLQSCPTLCNPIDGSPPGSPIPGILQARTLVWVVMLSSRGSSQSRDRT